MLNVLSCSISRFLVCLGVVCWILSRCVNEAAHLVWPSCSEGQWLDGSSLMVGRVYSRSSSIPCAKNSLIHIRNQLNSGMEEKATTVYGLRMLQTPQ